MGAPGPDQFSVIARRRQRLEVPGSHNIVGQSAPHRHALLLVDQQAVLLHLDVGLQLLLLARIGKSRSRIIMVVVVVAILPSLSDKSQLSFVITNSCFALFYLVGFKISKSFITLNPLLFQALD